MKKINLSREAFDYLFIQRGEISHIDNPAEWALAYEQSLQLQFASIKAHLPKLKAINVLDIGGGIGGINIPLARHYEYLSTCIVDGINDSCVMHRHAQTFNNASVGIEFLTANGVPSVEYHAPEWDFKDARKFGLVISFASYCFHYPPSTYLDRILASIEPQTVLIFDVRRDRQWEDQLQSAFGPAQIIAEGRKFQRMAFRVESAQ